MRSMVREDVTVIVFLGRELVVTVDAQDLLRRRTKGNPSGVHAVGSAYLPVPGMSAPAD